jgi:hypothetical protein
MISILYNGSIPSQVEGWVYRLLESMAMATESRLAAMQRARQRGLQEYQCFRHLLRNLYADDLRGEPIEHLIEQLRKPGHCWILTSEVLRLAASDRQRARMTTTSIDLTTISVSKAEGCQRSLSAQDNSFI